MLTLDRLKEVLSYDPESGAWTWRVALSRRVRVGADAGHLNAGGYRRVTVCGRRFLSHRLAWFYMTGGWPPADIDHVNGDPSDCRWSNLRGADRSQNKANSKRYKNNQCGFKGVTWEPRKKAYRATLYFRHRRFRAGYFKTPELAHQAYCELAQRHHGDFANLSP